MEKIGRTAKEFFSERDCDSSGDGPLMISLDKANAIFRDYLARESVPLFGTVDAEGQPHNVWTRDLPPTENAKLGYLICVD